MEETTKFMNALVKVAEFMYPNIVVEYKRTERIEHPKGVDMTYEIGGYDAETKNKLTILSRGFVLSKGGMQIEFIENGNTRYFPFFGINWKYLM